MVAICMVSGANGQEISFVEPSEGKPISAAQQTVSVPTPAASEPAPCRDTVLDNSGFMESTVSQRVKEKKPGVRA